jgi:hypothetical protein
VERGVGDIREPYRSTPGFISESRNRRSANGSTLRRWIAATTPTTVRPAAWSFCSVDVSDPGGPQLDRLVNFSAACPCPDGLMQDGTQAMG